MTRKLNFNLGTEDEPVYVTLCFWKVGDRWVCMATNEVLNDLMEIAETGKPVGWKPKTTPTLTIIK